MEKIKILIAEDEILISEHIKSILEFKGYEIPGIAATGKEAIKMSEKYKPDLILMDIMLLGEIDGIEAVKEIKKKINVPVIYITAHSDKGTLERAKATNPFGFLLKPVKQNELLSTIDLALYRNENEQDFFEIVSSSSEAIMAFDAASRNIIEINKACEKLYGYSRDEFLKLKHHHITAEPDESEITIQESSTGKLQIIPLRYHKKKDGTIFPVEITAGIYLRSGEKLLYGIIRDISKRLESEESSKKIKEMFGLILNYTSDIIFVLDFNWKICQASKRAEEIFKLKSGSAISRSMDKIIDNFENTEIYRTCKEVMTNMRPGKVIESIKTKGGKELKIEINVSSISDGIICMASIVS